MQRIKELKGLKDNESYLLDPLSCPHIVESISVMNNDKSSFRINNVNV